MMIFVTISGAREATSEMNEKSTDAISRKSIIAIVITTSRGDASETRAKTRGVISETRAKTRGVISETRAKTRGVISETRTRTRGVISETRARTRGVISDTRARTRGAAGPWGGCRPTRAKGYTGWSPRRHGT